jgi:3-methylcrotonyl-CoA carboxylase alpha subunit
MSSKTVDQMFSKILVANRGEIACRVMETASHLGIETVAVFSDADRNALHVEMADEAVHIGGSAPADSYLQMQRIIDAAKASGCQAIHPGYGFLSENAEFCALCAAQNLIFIGPPAAAIEAMGSKSAAKQIMQDAGVPLLPGYHGDDQDEAKLKQAADDMGYPVLLKAVAGGGGKGMRQVHRANDFSAALAAAKREAQSGFGDDAMLIEKYLERARHVEVQVFCDSCGDGVYLFERDCSVQRRHQKIVEEAPAPGVDNALRARMGEAALRAAAAVGYVGAGTVEFLLDERGEFFFMEMNTRLQVEHPVTEMITGTDLVAWQLAIASGERLPKTQDELSINGHAIEVRIYAENPDKDFLPAAGTLWRLQQPEPSSHVRIDTGVVQGDAVGVFYDPMIAKLIVWGENRHLAIQRLERALADYKIAGVITNVDFLRRLCAHSGFKDANLRTDFIEQHRAALFSHVEHTQSLAQLGLYLSLAPTGAANLNRQSDPTSPWHVTDAWRMNAPSRWSHSVTVDEETHAITVQQDGAFTVSVADTIYRGEAKLEGSILSCELDGTKSRVEIFEQALTQQRELVVFGGEQSLTCRTLAPDFGDALRTSSRANFKAPMNGTLVALFVEAGQQVEADTTLAIMEAMKMEHAIKTPYAGTVTDVFYSVGDLVDGGADLLNFVPLEQT